MRESQQLVFHPFRLDLANGQLWRAAEQLPIRLKTYAVLRYLIDRRERVVGRDELSRAIWPGRVGAEAAPRQCILELRKLLGDSARNPRFIATIGRHGYRFIGRLDATPSLFAPATRMDCDRLDRALGTECVGREAWLSRLAEAWEQARAGRPRTVMLMGPAGIGKSTLATAFVRTVAANRHGWVTCGQCIHQSAGGEAYLALLDALGTLARQDRHGHLASLLDRHAPLWLSQLPALIPPGGEATLRERIQGADPARMPRELIELLEVLTGDEPGVLLLEDLQWATRATLEWLDAWTRRRTSARLLIIGAWRTDDGLLEPLRDPRANEWLREWRWRPAFAVLQLTGLEQTAVQSYLVARLGDAALASSLAPILHGRSGGHPFLMNALVDEWVTRQDLARVDGEWRLRADLDFLFRTD